MVNKFDFLPGDVLSWSVKECNDTWPDAAVGSDRNGKMGLNLIEPTTPSTQKDHHLGVLDLRTGYVRTYRLDGLDGQDD